MKINLLLILINDNVVPYDDTLMKIQATQGQMNTILVGCNTASVIKEFINQAKRKQHYFFLPKTTTRTVPVTLSSTPTYAKNDDHDVYLYHRWNNKKHNKNTSTGKKASPV